MFYCVSCPSKKVTIVTANDIFLKVLKRIVSFSSRFMLKYFPCIEILNNYFNRGFWIFSTMVTTWLFFPQSSCTAFIIVLMVYNDRAFLCIVLSVKCPPLFFVNCLSIRLRCSICRSRGTLLPIPPT